MRIRWCCCRSLGRVRTHFFIASILLLLLAGVSLTFLLPNNEDRSILLKLRQSSNNSLTLLDPEDSFTIIMQTYNRTDILLKLLNHYQAVPYLQCIIIVWNNPSELPPRKLWDALGPHPVPIIFKEQSVNRMRNRLQPHPEIKTDAVLMLDDDTLVSVPDISFTFSVWKQFSDQIVGFVPRKHVSTASGVYSYGSFELQDPDKGGGDRYSMILVGAAFFHRRFLQLFQEQPGEVHALVDQTQNCDDIAMNFAVARQLSQASGLQRPSGVFVKPVDMRNLEKEASSGYVGMWHRAEHMLQRSYCLNKLTHIYGNMPLRYSNIMISQFGFPSYANHKSRI
ncbi:exostosin-like 2 isoform X1 [Sinocyclocheilus anshuiensis]|uniref:exostosin-like 2 isoform X1 n=1 Tax=Sinocyclocheilus anshuiensis TaxID=1608454 RepID=UPI0007B79122|nr:PREDICTED: exostosin-like 2 isoform X1 [Sinocyclocheilus anshuiensis]